jgi:hypothetical protein
MDPPGNFKRRDLPRSLRRLTEHKSQVRPDHCRKRGIRFPPISCSNFSLIGVSMSFLLSKSQTSSETAQHQAPDFCTWRFSKSWLPTSATKRAAQGKSIGTNLHLWNHYRTAYQICWRFFPSLLFLSWFKRVETWNAPFHSQQGSVGSPARPAAYHSESWPSLNGDLAMCRFQGMLF